METLFQILFIFLFIVFLIIIIYGICKFINILNNILKYYKDVFEYEVEIPSFINIDSNIISTDAITNIAKLYDDNGVSYRLLIETIDKKEPIIFSFDTSNECRNVFNQLNDILDSRIIVTNY